MTTHPIRKPWEKPQFGIIGSNELNNKTNPNEHERNFTAISGHPGDYRYNGGGHFPLASKDIYVS